MILDKMFKELKTKGFVSDAGMAEGTVSHRKDGDYKKQGGEWIKVEAGKGGNKSETSSPTEHPDLESFKKNAKPGDFLKQANGRISVKTKNGMSFANNEEDLKGIYSKLKMDVPNITGSKNSSSGSSSKTASFANKAESKSSSSAGMSLKGVRTGKPVNIKPSSNEELNKVFKAVSNKLSFGGDSGSVDNLIQKRDDGSFVMNVINPNMGGKGTMAQAVGNSNNSNEKLIIKPSGKGYEVLLHERGGGGNPDKTTSMGKI